MKKFAFILVLSTLFICVFGASCKESESLYGYVCELQSELYEGKTETYCLKASYGFKTNENGEKIYALKVKLLDMDGTNSAFSLRLNYNGLDYLENFTFNPVSGALIATIEIDNFNETQFPAQVKNGSLVEEIIFFSVKPADTVPPDTALNSLLKSQSELIKNYKDGETFNGYIKLRLLVKNETAYWYVGLVDESGNEKALLIDGKNLNVLAIRDIF